MRYGLIYRPPDTNLENSKELFKVIHDNLKNVKLFCLMGDFNLPDINWQTDTAISQISRDFLTLCSRIGAIQYVDFPTRGNNILDLVLFSDKYIVKSIRAETPFSTSDHDSIVCEIVKPFVNIGDSISKPCFKKADYVLINAFLSTLDWEDIFSDCESVNDYWLAFKGILDNVISNFVPNVNQSNHKRVPWFNNNLRSLRNQKQRKWKAYRNSRNIVSHAEYKRAARNFRSEFLNEKCNYEKSLFQKKNHSNKFYGYVKSQSTVKSSIPCIKRNDGSFAMSDSEKASEFVDYFSTVFVEDDNTLPEMQSDCNDTLTHFHCTPTDIIKIVKKLRSNTAPGPDGITALFLKNIIAHIADPLSKVYNRSLQEGNLPHDWKKALIIPLYKKGDAQLTTQYRPVSLTSVICKILERIIRSQLLNYLLQNDIIPKEQHGFLPKKSTVTNLLHCLNNWTDNFDKRFSTNIIYLDYSKCFDKVCHNKLIYKLRTYGIIDCALKWIENFLKERVQQVKVNENISHATGVKSGVPQGTVLGPILFLCYSADLANVVLHSKISMYADDTKLYKCIRNENDCRLLQEDLNRVAQWANMWQMDLNPDKTRLLVIGNQNVNFEYMLDNEIIETVNFINDIGVTIQSNLKFTMHCVNIVKKAYFVIHKIFSIFKNHDYHFYLKMYLCYVRPLLEYSSQVWSPALQCNIDKVERVQRYYTRRILKHVNMSYEQRLEFLSIEKLETRRKKADLIFFYKIINGLTDVNLNEETDVYKFVNSSRGHNKHLFTYYSRTDKRKYFWSNRIVKNWNDLEEQIVNSTSTKAFANSIRNAII